jgi:hypothetical protein
MAPSRTLLADTKFWSNRSRGLALFVSEGFFAAWRLPREFDSVFWVGGRFYMKPLFPLVDAGHDYFVLALSHKQARLFKGAAGQVMELAVPNMPRGIDEFTDHAPPDGSLQWHSGQKGAGKEGKVYHGQGGSHDHQKDHDLGVYLRAVEGAVNPILHGRTAPLVFIGVAELLPPYREICAYPHLLADGIHTNPDRLNEEEVQTRAAEWLAPFWQRHQDADAAMCEEQAAAGRVTSSIEEILKMAAAGGIESLFVAGNTPLWGKWDRLKEIATISETYRPGDEDLLDLAAMLVHRGRGRVHVVHADKVPCGILATALLRYTLKCEKVAAR